MLIEKRAERIHTKIGLSLEFIARLKSSLGIRPKIHIMLRSMTWTIYVLSLRGESKKDLACFM